MERLCRVVGFSTEQTAKLMLGEKIEHNGTLYSEEYKRNFVTDKVTAQIVTNFNCWKEQIGANHQSKKCFRLVQGAV